MREGCTFYDDFDAFIEHPMDAVIIANNFHVHAALAMSSVAILVHRSALEDGKPYDVPDFHNEEERARYENDWLTPFPGKNGEPPPCPPRQASPAISRARGSAPPTASLWSKIYRNKARAAPSKRYRSLFRLRGGRKEKANTF